MDWKLLASHGCGTCEKACSLLTESFFQDFKNSSVIKERIVIVHFDGVGTVVINHIGWNPFAEIRLETVNPVVEQDRQLCFEPGTSFRICEVHDGQTCLPIIALPDTAVRLLQKI